MTTFNAQSLKTPQGQQFFEQEKSRAWQLQNFRGDINFASHTLTLILEHDPTLNLTPARVQEAMIFYMSKQTELEVSSTGRDWLTYQSRLLSSDSRLNPTNYLN